MATRHGAPAHPAAVLYFPFPRAQGFGDGPRLGNAPPAGPAVGRGASERVVEVTHCLVGAWWESTGEFGYPEK